MRFRHQAKCVCAVIVAFTTVATAEKQYRSPEEFDLYTRVSKALAANDFTGALAGLDVWKQKFADSDFASNRQQLYVHAYARSGQPAKAIQSAGAALAGPFDTPDDELRLLYAVVNAVQQIPSPEPELHDVVRNAARRLLEFNNMPTGMTAEEWQKARTLLQTSASVAFVHVALTPAREAIAAKDCAGAEQIATKAVQEFPESAQASWVLASAQLCLARTMAAKFPSALYHLARSAALDPTKGLVDPSWQTRTAAPYLEKMYVQYHGPDPEGLRELKDLALKEPLPPPGFAIASAAELEQKRQADLESKNPELALWLRIKAALNAPNGATYFTSEMKGAAVPRLEGTVVQGRPECRSRELLVALTKPDAGPEVLLKLEAPLTGRLAAGAEIQFQGAAMSFAQDPFLLTMSVDPAAISGVKLSPCAAGAPRARRR